MTTGHCKDCKHWGAIWVEVCDFIETIPADNPVNGLAIDLHADDDSGLYANLKTGPEFGCIHFSKVQS